MAISHFSHVKITGIDYVIPSNICRDVDDYVHLFDNNKKKLARAKELIGYGKRYSVPEGVTTVDMCVQSAECLISKLNISKESIDAVIFVTQTPDYISPSSAHVIQKKLGLSMSCALFDITQGCTGYVYGLWVASSLIESRAVNRILLCVGDVAPVDNRLETKGSLLTYSDAVCTTILEYSEENIPSHYLIGSDGYQFETMIIPAGGLRMPVNEQILQTILIDKDDSQWSLTGSFMDGLAVVDFAMNVVPGHINELLSVSQLSIDCIEFFAVHQINKQLLETFALKVGIPDTKYYADTFIKYGNTSGISCILNFLDYCDNNIVDKSKPFALISYGIGLSWASTILNFNYLKYADIRFVLFKAEKTSDMEFKYWCDKIQNYSAIK